MPTSDLRPLPVLEDTLDYLLSFLDSSEHPFEVVHDFIFDRTRSIRQDLSMQNIDNEKAIYMYEKMVWLSCQNLSILNLHLSHKPFNISISLLLTCIYPILAFSFSKPFQSMLSTTTTTKFWSQNLNLCY